MRITVLNEPSLFSTRADAGAILAARLSAMVEATDVCRVLAIPPGGVLVAEAIADRLNLPLDVVVVNDLVLPSSRHAVKLGAVTVGGHVAADEGELSRDHVAAWVPEHLARLARAELMRLEMLYHQGGCPAEPKGELAVIVDDGLASGFALRAAAASMQAAGARRVIVATPLIAAAVREHLSGMGVEVVAVLSCDRERTGVSELLYGDDLPPDPESALEALVRSRRRVPDSWSKTPRPAEREG